MLYPSKEQSETFETVIACYSLVMLAASSPKKNSLRYGFRFACVNIPKETRSDQEFLTKQGESHRSSKFGRARSQGLT